MALRTLAVLTIVGAICACGGGDGMAPTSSPPGDALVIKQREFYFEPDTLFMASGDDRRFEVRNDGAVSHTVTIDALFVDEELSPGESMIISLGEVEGGDYLFYCRFHRDQGMQGTLGFFEAGGAS